MSTTNPSDEGRVKLPEDPEAVLRALLAVKPTDENQDNEPENDEDPAD